jgi:small conductance mechanosensitive channel
MDLTETPEQLSALAAMVWAWALAFLPRLGGAILLLLIGFIAAGWAARLLTRMLSRSGRVSATVVPVLAAAIRYSILILILVAALGQLGVQTASLLAVLGAAGLAIGLALQGTLSNIAAGIMLLWLRPFNIGDAIETIDVSGTVEELGLFNTQLKTPDGIFKFVPNSQLWNTVLTNYSRNPTRLVLIEFGISYENDMAKGRRVLLEVASAHPSVLDDPAPSVVPLRLDETAVVLQLRAWTPTPAFAATQWELTEAGKERLATAGISFPSPQRLLRIVSESRAHDGDPASSAAP